MPINAGLLNVRVRIEVRAAGVDALGQASETWQEVAELWARPRPLQGREFFAAGGQLAESSGTWELRYRADITPKMRLVDLRAGGLTYDIQAVLPDAQHEGMDLVCTSGAGDAI